CDWINDDMPYVMQVNGRLIHSMPHSTDIDDYTVLIANHHDEDEYRDQVIDQFDELYAESASQGGRVLCLPLNPWITGQPYRIGTLEQILEHIMRQPGIWPATGAEILDAWKKAG